MANNQLLFGTIIAVLLYWLAAFVVPDPYLSSLASFTLLAFGGATCAKYAPVAWEVIVNGKRLNNGEGVEGSHLAVLGTAMLGAGAVYSGLFAISWYLAGQPDYWLGTPVSGFGRGLMAGGFWLMYASPEVIKRDMRVPGIAWLVVIVVASVLTGFYLGSTLELGNS